MTTANSSRTTFVRWIKFNLVGGIGVLVQLALLTVFSEVIHVSYIVATAVAVELTVLHNFAWHERYTWNDLALAFGASPETSPGACPCGSHQALASRLVRFHFGNGAVSIVGNLMLMKILASKLHVPLLAANATAITVCSLVNFCLADSWVFARG